MEWKKIFRLVGRVLANGPGDRVSISGRVIPKTLKMIHDTSLLTLSNIRYISMVKWSNPGKGVPLFPSSLCSIYWKGSLLFALDYGRQLYLLYCCWEILRFANWLTTSHPPPLTCHPPPACWNCKWPKGKRQGPPQTQFSLSRTTTILWWERFPGPAETASPPNRGTKKSQKSFLTNYEFNGPPSVCAQSVCPADAARNRRHNLLFRPLALANKCALTSSRGKKCVSSVETCQETEEEFLFGDREVIFQACVDSASFQRPPGKLLFLYLFISFRVYFFMLYFYFFFFFTSVKVPQLTLAWKLAKTERIIIIIIWDFEIQTDYLISARRLDQVIFNKKREPNE